MGVHLAAECLALAHAVVKLLIKYEGASEPLVAHLVQEHHGVQQQDLVLLLVDVYEVDVEVVAEAEEGA